MATASCIISTSETGDYTVELEAVSQKPAVLHHGAGLVDLGTAGKTYYYSRTRLETSGTVSVSGVSSPCHGSILDGPPVG